ncbi:unnamed protein product [Adineta steineri]|nr:unnamed protein product [Adineta steineri]
MEILTKLIIIFVISVIYVQGEISSTKIKDDAAKMVEIYGNYLMYPPNNTIRGIFRSQCTILPLCCEGSEDQVINILDSQTFQENCLNNPVVTFSYFLPFCSNEIESLNEIKKSSEYGRFMKIHRGVPGSDELIINWQSQMKKACTKEEVIYYYCKSDDMKLIQLCQEKVLQSLANKNTTQNYDAFLHNWMNVFTTLNKRISKEFPKST